ncbi:MAG: LemA family protein [Cyclobacteriaceae bacterium]|nr:LemA family protein [Cyclobacteriaceae bacterium]
MIALILLVVVVLIVFWAISIYNRLVKHKNLVKEGWSGIDVQLKRRTDLIPNLLETVKGYAKHEEDLFKKVTELRARSMDAQGVAEQGQAESALSQSLMNLFAVAENYPELKADQNFRQLQTELSSLEDHIQMARRYYNGTARDFNILIESFPSNLVANSFGFQMAEYFEIDSQEREVPEVKF